MISLRNVFLILALAAALLLFVTPLANQYGAFVNLDGSVGIIDHMDLWSSRDPLTFIAYFLGDFFCPQQADRSFVLNGSQMAFCMRDVSVLVGFIAGCLLTFIGRVGSVPVGKALAMLAAAAALLLADWTVQHFCGLNVPATRVITGALAGTAFAVLISSYDNIISSGRQSREHVRQNRHR